MTLRDACPLVAMLHDIYIRRHMIFLARSSVVKQRDNKQEKHKMFVGVQQPKENRHQEDVSTRLIVRRSRSPTTLTSPSASIAAITSLNSPASKRILL
jgi:hypothetical protein